MKTTKPDAFLVSLLSRRGPEWAISKQQRKQGVMPHRNLARQTRTRQARNRAALAEGLRDD